MRISDWSSDVCSSDLLVEGMGATAVAMAIDVSDPDWVETMLEGTCREFGRLDAAFNNAGILQKAGLMADAETSEWDEVMQVNAKGVWLCMRAEIRRMRERKRGSIVNKAERKRTRLNYNHKCA